MSELALSIGPELVIDAPPPVAPRHTVLTVAREIADVIDGAGNVVERWGNGVQVLPYPVTEWPYGFDPCSAGTFRVKGEGQATPDSPSFAAFTAYLPVKCRAGGMDDDEFRARVVAAFDSQIHYPMERQLILGEYLPENPYVAKDSNYIGGGARGLRLALVALEEHMADLYQNEFVIHASPGTAEGWFGMGMLYRDGSILRTGNGNPVYIYRGAYGAHPEPEPGVTPDEEAWAFATSPIFYKLGPVVVNPPTIREALDRTTNQLVYRAERDVLIGWDMTLHTGILVDLTTP